MEGPKAGFRLLENECYAQLAMSALGEAGTAAQHSGHCFARLRIFFLAYKSQLLLLLPSPPLPTTGEYIPQV